MNIAITSASGNIGKSTICLNLSLSLNDNFENISLYDCDERMETLKEIMTLRKKNKLSYLKVETDLAKIEKGLNNKTNLNIFDLKGHLGQKEALILNESDLVLVITSNEDLVLKKTLKLCKDLDDSNIKYFVLINKFNDKLETFDNIKNMFKGKVLTSYLKDKISYKRIDQDGSLFYDKKDSLVGLRTTKLEFENFVEEFLEIIQKI